ncbi:APH(3') family aminoglycoside O-phosphotransferase [Spirillospora sp. CA-294931]|uniref:APH(3') family aminoglycoside O-phosphotransferase n=1 Tax=Spirillospora sp. CA-294931 TaxID=3240042 RepID=UPI003D8F2795
MDSVLDLLRERHGRDGWEPVTEGMSGAGVWRAEGAGRACFVKVVDGRGERPGAGHALEAEAERSAWLRDKGLPAPPVLEFGTRDGVTWLVTAALPGRSAAAPWPAERRDGVVDALAGLARSLHALPVADCPFDQSLKVTVAQARDAAANGSVELDQLDDERAGWDEARLLAALDLTRPAVEDLVVCHGDLCLPNVLLDPVSLRVTGVIDLGRLGVADRHADLALMARSIADEWLNSQYDGEHVRRFLRAYGGETDPERLAFYRLLDEFF